MTGEDQRCSQRREQESKTLFSLQSWKALCVCVCVCVCVWWGSLISGTNLCNSVKFHDVIDSAFADKTFPEAQKGRMENLLTAPVPPVAPQAARGRRTLVASALVISPSSFPSSPGNYQRQLRGAVVPHVSQKLLPAQDVSASCSRDAGLSHIYPIPTAAWS